jgi:hypothetical protein
MAVQTIRILAGLPAGDYTVNVQADPSSTNAFSDLTLTPESSGVFWTFQVSNATAGVYSYQVLDDTDSPVAYGWFYSDTNTTSTIGESDSRDSAVLVSTQETPAVPTVVVYPLNASMPVRSIAPNITLYTGETGVVVGPIRVTSKDGNTVVPVDLSGRELQVRFVDYLGTELLVVNSELITISGDDSDQFTFPVTADLTGTPTEDREDQYHIWSLRDLNTGNNVLISGKARVLLS